MERDGDLERKATAMIQLHEVTKLRADQKILDGVTMAVERGEVAVIVGPSGGGKTTLLRCINGLEPLDGGEVRVDDVVLRAGRTGRRAEESLRALRRRVGMVFQGFNLFPHLTVLENVLAGPLHVLKTPRDQAEAEARRLLDRVGMGGKLAARPDELSGGQQQRVAIARALAMRPEAILFDEPTSALDPQMAGEVLSVIADLARAGQTMVVVTHAMGFARQAATTIHVMHRGRVAESGPPSQIFDAPREEVTRSFLADLKAS